MRREALCLAVLLTACSQATYYVKPLPPLARIPAAELERKFDLPSSSREVKLTDLVYALPPGYTVGQSSYGYEGICTNASANIYEKNWFGLPLKFYADLFNKVMQQHGYPVDPGTALFEGERVADLRVGAKIVEAVSNTCTPRMVSDNSRRIGNAYFKIAWSVYSNLDKKVIFELTTEGTTYETIETRLTTTALLRIAFEDAAQRLALSEDYRALVASPVRPSP